jgi:hypothetical protein
MSADKQQYTKAYTAEPIRVPNQPQHTPQQANQPEFIRLPRPGMRCDWTGLSRSKLNQLILPCEANCNNPPVKSVSLRIPGSKRGARLIALESLLTYLWARIEGGSR